MNEKTGFKKVIKLKTSDKTILILARFGNN